MDCTWTCYAVFGIGRLSIILCYYCLNAIWIMCWCCTRIIIFIAFGLWFITDMNTSAENDVLLLLLVLLINNYLVSLLLLILLLQYIKNHTGAAIIDGRINSSSSKVIIIMNFMILLVLHYEIGANKIIILGAPGFFLFVACTALIY